MSLVALLIPFPLLVFLYTGLGVLQYFLSKKDSPWPGLLLPFLSFICSFIYVFPVRYFAVYWTSFEMIPLILMVTTIAANIPTLVYIILYTVQRSAMRRHRKAQLNRMNIQDLD